ncbi:MAG: class I SAM-dependent methyltransferase [Dehalococcoidia bacterium]|nr:class I SAM-dependent methyltransferase [Dehalococcoidia bacterium]
MGTSETIQTQKRYDRQAWLYDLKEWPVEFAFKPLRRRLWSEVRGNLVLEIGVGTGKNFSHHPPGARVLGIDISPQMLARAARRARRLGRDIDLVLADAQRLPFRDGVFDAAAATFVFCSVPDPVAGLQEARRVVTGGGRIHLAEHVRARNRVAGWIMDRLNPIVVRMMGANINRDTVANVTTAGIGIDGVQSRAFGIIKLIRGARTQKQSESARQRERMGRAVSSDVSRG